MVVWCCCGPMKMPVKMPLSSGLYDKSNGTVHKAINMLCHTTPFYQRRL